MNFSRELFHYNRCIYSAGWPALVLIVCKRGFIVPNPVLVLCAKIHLLGPFYSLFCLYQLKGAALPESLSCGKYLSYTTQLSHLELFNATDQCDTEAEV